MYFRKGNSLGRFGSGGKGSEGLGRQSLKAILKTKCFVEIVLRLEKALLGSLHECLPACLSDSAMSSSTSESIILRLGL